MSTATRLPPDARRAEILGVARRLFTDNDYAEVSMAWIAREAGVTPGLVNHYLGTKREVYLAVLAEIAERMPEMVRTDLRDLPTEEMVSRNTDGFLDAMSSEREGMALLFGAQSSRDEDVLRIVASVRRTIIDRMADNHSPDPSDELKLSLRIFQGAALEGAGRWLSGRAEREDVHRILCTMLVALVEEIEG